MSIKILMPALSPTMKEGNLQKWLVKVGDSIKAGDVLAEIETDKATMEVEAVDEGKISKILVQEGAEAVPVNSTIAILDGSEDEEQNITTTNKQTGELKDKNNLKIVDQNISNNDNLSIKKSTNISTSINTNTSIFASPYVRKIAKEENLNLNSLKGSGTNGRIVKRDIENIDKQNQLYNLSLKYEEIEPSSIRKIIAEKTTYTKSSVPHFYLTIETNVDKLLKLRKKINEQYKKNTVSINDILVKALALSQKNNPETNVSWVNGKIIRYNSVDVSIAVALKEGLITPIIKNAENKGLLEISQELKVLIKKAKNGKLSIEEYSGGTISISNLGMYGISEFTAIINPPQSSILAIGRIQEVPKLYNKEIKIVNIIKSTLSADHRVLDGAVAAKLLKDFNDIVENPYDLWLQSKDMKII